MRADARAPSDRADQWRGPLILGRLKAAATPEIELLESLVLLVADLCEDRVQPCASNLATGAPAGTYAPSLGLAPTSD